MNRAQAKTDERRRQVAQLYLRGKVQREIAQIVGVSQQQVSFDLQYARAMWQAQMIEAIGAQKAQHLAEVRETIRAAWDGWERSCAHKEVSVTKAVEGDRARREATLRKEGQAGDPSFLEKVQKGLDQIADLLGLNPARRLKLDLEAMTEDQLLRIAAGEPPERVLQPSMAEA